MSFLQNSCYDNISVSLIGRTGDGGMDGVSFVSETGSSHTEDNTSPDGSFPFFSSKT